MDFYFYLDVTCTTFQVNTHPFLSGQIKLKCFIRRNILKLDNVIKIFLIL